MWPDSIQILPEIQQNLVEFVHYLVTLVIFFLLNSNQIIYLKKNETASDPTELGQDGAVAGYDSLDPATQGEWRKSCHTQYPARSYHQASKSFFSLINSMWKSWKSQKSRKIAILYWTFLELIDWRFFSHVLWLFFETNDHKMFVDKLDG